MKRLSYAAALLVAFGAPAFAQEKLPEGAKVKKLEVRPTKIELNGPFAYSQLLVTAVLDNGEQFDATRVAKIAAPKNAAVNPLGQVRPTADGTGNVAVSLAGVTANVPLTVKGFKEDKAVSFVTDVQPVLGKLGCNAGTCHGAQAGKNGFKLSLRGYDAIYDFRALTDDLEGRRFNRAAPEKSLMLLKPAGAVPHQGGVTMQADDPNYELIRRWIAQGVKLDLDAVRVKSIEMFPKNPIVSRIGQKQQFAVLATYADGRVRDVTAETFIDSSNTEVATVDKATGLVTTVRRGEATMLARYEGAYAASTVVIMGDRTGFTWAQRPVYNYIDELVDAKLKKVKVQASELADDATFFRRVHLDLTGLPPAPEQVVAFVNDKRDSRVKRDEVIEHLVGSDAYVEHWSNKWADMLMVNRKFLGDVGAKAFREWIRARVAENKPYDKFAYDILTATGSNVANPPASYFKTLRTADAVMENTTQLFLAVRFNCNKCHDHPFEKWTQDQYYQLASYFAQVGRRPDPKYPGNIGGTAVEGAKPLAEIITDQNSGEIKHERTGETAKPKFPYPVDVEEPDAGTRRVQVAKWITSPENPYFARSYVNRVWSYMLGVGLIEPVDDIRAGNPPTNPELLDALTQDFIKSGFDTQKLIKTICKSRTYQLSLATNKWNKDDEINYSHALARRLPAEVLFDAIHKATGSQSKLPGLPVGARAAQLVDSNVELPGGFLDLFNKPVRESSCECERGTGLNLGPILAMVNGPIVGEAIKDPNNRINQLVLKEKDDGKLADQIYLSVLNRLPTAKERAAAVQAIEAAKKDHAEMMAEYKPKADAFAAYKAGLDAKQKAWEESLKGQKPTKWHTLDIRRAESKQGAPASAKPGATLTVNKDGSIFASGKTDNIDIYTVTGLAEIDAPITAMRLEVLADPRLPSKGPGRADNGNFVLHEFRVSAKPLDKPDSASAPIKLTAIQSIFAQDTFPAANAVDGNLATGWATFPRVGQDNAALFKFDKPVSGPAGVYFTVVLDQRFGQKHVIGKFRLSVTTEANPRLGSSITPEQFAALETPVGKRTQAQKDMLRLKYLEQDKEYARLALDAANPPPSDARVLGAQDLVWALINTPAFLFNR